MIYVQSLLMNFLHLVPAAYAHRVGLSSGDARRISRVRAFIAINFHAERGSNGDFGLWRACRRDANVSADQPQDRTFCCRVSPRHVTETVSRGPGRGHDVILSGSQYYN